MDGECGLSQEILVVEHVDLVHHEAQEGEGGVAHRELESLSGPGGIQTIISWRGCRINTARFECVLEIILNLPLRVKNQDELCTGITVTHSAKQRRDLRAKRKPVSQVSRCQPLNEVIHLAAHRSLASLTL